MKNNRRKIIAAVVCGIVLGSVGTSFIGNFEVKNNETAVYFSNDNGEKTFNHEGGGKGNMQGERGQHGHEEKGNHHKGAASIDSAEGVNVADGNYKDGTYTGTADGYAENLKVQVDISGGQIKSVEVVSHNETPGFYEKAFDKVPAEIVEAQSTEVDTATGATYSSVGIINAVNSALESAKA